MFCCLGTGGKKRGSTEAQLQRPQVETATEASVRRLIHREELAAAAGCNRRSVFRGCFLLMPPFFSTWFSVLLINISSVVEFQRWWVLKSKIFAKNQHASRKSLYFVN
jgi:hypothetical protein